MADTCTRGNILACWIKSHSKLLQVHFFGSTFCSFTHHQEHFNKDVRGKRARSKLCALKTLTAVSNLGNLAFPGLLIPYVVNAKETKIIKYVKFPVARSLILMGLQYSSLIFFYHWWVCIKPSLFPLCFYYLKLEFPHLSSSLPLFVHVPSVHFDICIIYQAIKTCSWTPSSDTITTLFISTASLWSSWWREGSPFNWTAILRLIKDFPTCKQTFSKSRTDWINDSGCDMKSLFTWDWYTDSEPGVLPKEHRENIQLPENE